MIERYYKYKAGELEDATLEEKIVFDIVDDISDRSGMWEIDSDIQSEIIESWVEIVKLWVR
jgi:hypothetical protein